MDLSIKEIINLVCHKYKLILALPLIGAGALFLCSKFVISPVYTSYVKLYVHSGTSEAVVAESLSELNYAQKVVNTYISFLQTKVFYTKVLEETKLNYSIEQLNKMTNIQSVNGTEIFQISVTANSAVETYKLSKAMQKIAPELIGGFTNNTNISVVDPAMLPDKPTGPNVMVYALFGGVFGLVLAFAIVLLIMVLDVKVHDEESLSKKYNLPVLGNIPGMDTGISNGIEKIKKIFRKKEKKWIPYDHAVLNEKSDFSSLEAYKALRTNLRYTLCHEGCKKIMVSSATPGDGKTTTCVNMGITISNLGARVLLMDCDLRKGRLHKVFGLKRSPGISDYISGIKTDKEVIQNTKYDNLQVMAIGAIPPNPIELLTSVQMEALIQNLSRFYDYIIIDTPPVNLVSDSLGLAKLVDGVLIVVKQNSTSHPDVKDAVHRYQLVEGRLLGFVFNGIRQMSGMRLKARYYYETEIED